MSKTADKTLIGTPFPSTDQVAKKFKLPKRRVQRVEGMMDLIQKKKQDLTKSQKKARVDAIDWKSKHPGIVSRGLIRKNNAGMFFIELGNEHSRLGSKALKEIVNDMRADGLAVKRSGVGVRIGPAKTQTDARRIAYQIVKMANTKDIALAVRLPKTAGARSTKEFVKKPE